MFCETPMVHHVRRFVHGSGCVQIVLKELDSPVPGYQHTILNYSWCRICKQVSATPKPLKEGFTEPRSFLKASRQSQRSSKAFDVWAVATGCCIIVC